jgi:putative membrane protein
MTANAAAVFQSWSPPVGLDVALCLTVLIYTRGWFRLHANFPGLIPPWRLVAFIAGISAVWIAIGSPLDAFDEFSLSLHMIQHLLLMAIAPPLLLLGAPELPLLRGLPRVVARSVVSPFLRSNSVRRFGHFLTNPALAWLAAAFALIGWHIPAAFDLALQRPWLHELEHATFFVAGIIFWWPVIQPWPSTARWRRWAIPLYLFCATLPCDVLSGFLAFCDRVVYPSYLSAPRVLGLTPLADQQSAAALMWFSVTIIYLVPAVIITIQILSPHAPHSSRMVAPTSCTLATGQAQTPKLEIIRAK